MASVSSMTTNALVGLLRSDAGVPLAIAELVASESIELPSVPAAQILAANIAPDLADRSQGV